MSDAGDLNRLEQIIGGILRAGIALAAVAMVIGLGLAAFGVGASRVVIDAGLVVLLMIPSARILASLVDAIIRRDKLLAGATAVVSIVIAEEVFRKLWEAFF